MKLGINIGNTTLQIAYYQQDLLVHHKININNSEDAFKSFILEHIKFNPSIINIASVVPPLSEIIMTILNEIFDCPINILNNNSKYLIDFSLYQNTQLGIDRILACLGALAYNYPNYMVIDCGTATTFNIVKNKQFVGGLIIPGLQTSITALSKSTALLNDENIEYENILYATNTKQAILSGVIKAHYHMINEYVKEINEEDQSIKIIITGGNANYLFTHLKFNFIYNPTLIMNPLICY